MLPCLYQWPILLGQWAGEMLESCTRQRLYGAIDWYVQIISARQYAYLVLQFSAATSIKLSLVWYWKHLVIQLATSSFASSQFILTVFKILPLRIRLQKKVEKQSSKLKLQISAFQYSWQSCLGYASRVWFELVLKWEGACWVPRQRYWVYAAAYTQDQLEVGSITLFFTTSAFWGALCMKVWWRHPSISAHVMSEDRFARKYRMLVWHASGVFKWLGGYRWTIISHFSPNLQMKEGGWLFCVIHHVWHRFDLLWKLSIWILQLCSQWLGFLCSFLMRRSIIGMLLLQYGQPEERIEFGVMV